MAPQVRHERREHLVQMDQRDYAFVPGVIALSEGEPVIFTNSDPANHNIRASSSVRTNEFNVYISEGINTNIVSLPRIAQFDLAATFIRGCGTC